MVYDGGYVIIDTDREAWHKYPPAGRCHDCCKPSRDYRCPTCMDSFQAKYLNYRHQCIVIGELPSLRDIFKGIQRDKIFRD